MAFKIILVATAVLLVGCSRFDAPPSGTTAANDAAVCKSIAETPAHGAGVYDPKTETAYASCMGARGH